jgi:hypothetical protein
MEKINPQKESELVQEQSPPNNELTGYTILSLKCACCKKFFQKGLFRNEDVAHLKTTKPVCPSCAMFLKKWSEKHEAEIQKLRFELKEHVNAIALFERYKRREAKP